MTSIRTIAALGAGVIAAGLTLLDAAPARAQNSEGAFQARAGAFLNLGDTRLHENDGSGPLTGRTGQFGVGGTGGFEYLREGAWTLGVEADLGLTGGNGAALNGVKYGADYFSSLRGRAGLYLRPDFVVYGTGGAAFKGISLTSAAFQTKTEKSLTGSIYGGGVELHRGGTILFAEYLHSNFGTIDVPFALGTTKVSADSNSFRLGVKFKLGYDGYYDYVRDDLRK